MYAYRPSTMLASIQKREIFLRWDVNTCCIMLRSAVWSINVDDMSPRMGKNEKKKNLNTHYECQ